MKHQSLELSVTEEMLMLTMIDRPRYGLEIIERVSEASRGERQINFGTLYPALRKLEGRGLLKSSEVEQRLPIRGGHRRRYYEITDLGLLALSEADRLRHRLRYLGDDFQPSI